MTTVPTIQQSKPKENLSLHPKQMEVFRSKARFRVVVAGRRWGKCLDENSLISLADGSIKKMKDVVVGDSVLSLNEETYTFEPKSVQAIHNNGVKETVIIKTNAREIACTPNHKFLVNGRWIEAKDINVNDLIAVPKQTVFGNDDIDMCVVELLAIWLAEGSFYTITNQTEEIIEVVKKALKKLDNSLYLKSKDGLNWRITNGGLKKNSNTFRKMLESFGLWGLNSKTKFIPDFIFRLPKHKLSRFLNLFVACDGNISNRCKNTWSVEIQLANEFIIKQLSDLFLKFGIKGQIRYKKHKLKSKRSNKNFESWRFIFSENKSILSFCDNIGCLSKENRVFLAKNSALEITMTNKNYYVPISYDDFISSNLSYELRDVGKFGGYNSCYKRGLPEDLKNNLNSWRKQNSSRVSKYRFSHLQKYTDGSFDKFILGEVDWEEVKSITPNKKVKTLDLTVDGNHNFIANGFVTHNSSLSKVLMITKAAKYPRQKVWYVAPTYKMAKQIMWNVLVDAVPKEWVRKYNESNLIITLVNGSRIELKGADKPDSLRGVGIDFLVLDEYQDMSEDTWTKVLRPTLADTKGHALIIGTPKQYNALYKAYTYGQNAKNVKKGLWESWQFPTITSPFIPESEIEAAKQDMDEKSFNQEFLASFEVMSGRVYYTFDRNIHVGEYKFNPKLPIWVGMDFNIDPMSAVIAQPQPDGEVWVIGEIVRFSSNTEEICDELDNQFFRHQKQITIYPDPAGGQRQHARGESDLDIMREKGFKKIKHRKKHPIIADRVNSVNRMLKTASGGVRLRIDSSCHHLIKSLEQTIYKPNSRDVDKTIGVEHSADALGYMIEYEFPLRKLEIIGVSI